MNIQGQSIDYIDIQKIVESIFGNTQHKKRIASIANAALGIISSASLIVHRIGRGMAKALGLLDKHAIKQVDRLLSNKKLNIEDCHEHWVPYVIGGRSDIKIAMDWTDFNSDDQTTLSLNLVTSHGRATPLLWKTFSKSKLKDNRNNYEDELLQRLRNIIPKNIKVTILADRGFCDIKLFEFLLKTLNFHYVIRIRGNILVENQKGEIREASEWVGENGKLKTIRNAKITHRKYEVSTFICVHDKQMKEPWCIVSSEEEISGSGVVKWYSKRWGCEPQFRDTKDIHFGMGLSKTSIGNPIRRDRLLLIHAISTAILTFLGAAGENIGLSKYLKANTSKKRTLSLLSQGIIYFSKIPKMTKDSLTILLTEFYELIEKNKNFIEVLGVI
jgi:hypothetical protein